MPDAVQRLYWQVLAQPERRIELIDNLSDEDFDQLAHFIDILTDVEHAAVERALGL